MAGMKRRIKIDKETHAFHKEMDEVSCPICMEHPHNAVLLLCSSHDKGCRPYICDTSYRHSNCLDRLRKPRTNSTSSSILAPNTHSHTNTSDANSAMRDYYYEANENHNSSDSNVVSSVGLTGELVVDSIQYNGEHLEGQGGTGAGEFGSSQRRTDREVLTTETSQGNLNLKCPLCRGTVLGWEVIEEARRYLNMKKRSCSRESCLYHGNYQELRRHARRVHPTSRPSDTDPTRERSWQRLEVQREYDDIVSAIHSAIPGAVVVGDYVIEDGDRSPFERESGSRQNGPWRTPFYFHMGSANTVESRTRSRAWLRHRQRRLSALSEHQNLWGGNLLRLQHDEENFPMAGDQNDNASPVPRRRRRLTLSRFDEDRT